MRIVLDNSLLRWNVFSRRARRKDRVVELVKQPAERSASAFTFSSSPWLPMCCNRSHTFLLCSERALLQQRFLKNIRTIATISSCSAVHLERLKSRWFAFRWVDFFCCLEEKDNKTQQKKVRRPSRAKNIKEFLCFGGFLVFKAKKKKRKSLCWRDCVARSWWSVRNRFGSCTNCDWSDLSEIKKNS